MYGGYYYQQAEVDSDIGRRLIGINTIGGDYLNTKPLTTTIVAMEREKPDHFLFIGPDLGLHRLEVETQIITPGGTVQLDTLTVTHVMSLPLTGVVAGNSAIDLDQNRLFILGNHLGERKLVEIDYMSKTVATHPIPRTYLAIGYYNEHIYSVTDCQTAGTGSLGCVGSGAFPSRHIAKYSLSSSQEVSQTLVTDQALLFQGAGDTDDQGTYYWSSVDTNGNSRVWSLSQDGTISASEPLQTKSGLGAALSLQGFILGEEPKRYYYPIIYGPYD